MHVVWSPLSSPRLFGKLAILRIDENMWLCRLCRLLLLLLSPLLYTRHFIWPVQHRKTIHLLLLRSVSLKRTFDRVFDRKLQILWCFVTDLCGRIHVKWAAIPIESNSQCERRRDKLSKEVEWINCGCGAWKKKNTDSETKRLRCAAFWKTYKIQRANRRPERWIKWTCVTLSINLHMEFLCTFNQIGLRVE